MENGSGVLPFGIAAIDTMLGGGLMRGALHEIAASAEAHSAAATGFALGLSSSCPALGSGLRPARAQALCRASTTSSNVSKQDVDGRDIGEQSDAVLRTAMPGHDRKGSSILWIAEEMARVESGVPHGAGLDAFGLAPERLVTVSVTHRRDLLWGMEEALRCRAVGVVIGEMRAGKIDAIAVRRLSLAAAESGALALLLRAAPPADSSTAATRWIVGAASSLPSPGGGGSPSEARRGGVTYEKSSPPPGALTRADLPPPEPAPGRAQARPGWGGERNARFAAHLVRNRRGPVGSWILEWSDSDERFILATHAQPVAAPAFDRPHRQVA